MFYLLKKHGMFYPTIKSQFVAAVFTLRMSAGRAPSIQQLAGQPSRAWPAGRLCSAKVVE